MYLRLLKECAELERQIMLLEEDNTYKPPKGVVENAKRILEIRDEHGDDVKGGTRVGWVRANQLASGDPVSKDIVKRMYSFFKRHDGNQKVDNKDHKNSPWKDSGWTAWEIWGGDEAYRWVSKLKRQFDREDD